MESREMYSEINALVGTVAKAFSVGEMEVVTAIEQGRLAMEMMTDEQGQNFLSVSYEDRKAQLYPGAIFREGDKPEPEKSGNCCGCCG